MSPAELAVLAAGLLLYGLVSGRVQGSVVTLPLAFAAFGFAVGHGALGLVELDPGHGTLHFLAEITLALVLFADAAHLDVRELARRRGLELRMLLVGLPLAILLGAGLAGWLFPEVSWAAAVLLAAILAPTDATLGQAVITSPAVPGGTRQVMTAESGLNDGLALPAVVIAAIAASGAAAGDRAEVASPASLARFAALQVVLGPVVGGAVGWAGGRLLDRAVAAGWTAEGFRGIALLAIALLAFALAEASGGNGFLAAFTGGVVVGCVVPHQCGRLLELMEAEGKLLTLFAFFLFGSVLLPEGLGRADLPVVLYALASLGLVRVLAVWISLAGAGLAAPTRLFLGWFGPRGLASILFVLLILERYPVPERDAIHSCVVLTVALSILLHGVSAGPLAEVYGRWARGTRAPGGPEAA